MICPTCGRDMEPRSHALGAYATITVMTCPVCLTTPEPVYEGQSRAPKISHEVLPRVAFGKVL